MKNDIISISIKHGFDNAYLLPQIISKDDVYSEVNNITKKILPDAQFILLLLKGHLPYSKFPCTSMSVHSHYPAYQNAYNLHKSLIEKLTAFGFKAESANSIPLKSYAVSTGLSRLRNSLAFHNEYGSYFVLQAIALDKKIDNISNTVRIDLCKDCTLCVKSCPANAINVNGIVNADKCLRNHIPVKDNISYDMRLKSEKSYIGCGICQSVCPLNEHINKINPSEKLIECLDIEKMLDMSQRKLQMNKLSDIIGKNEVRSNRVLATACLAAGNSQDEKYLPYLKVILTGNLKSLPRSYAAWAIGKIGENSSFFKKHLVNESDSFVRDEIINSLK